MSVRDLVPWNRGRDVTVRRGEEANPFLALHREMNRLFDDVFRGRTSPGSSERNSAHLTAV
jgi:HSP20 family protein